MSSGRRGEAAAAAGKALLPPASSLQPPRILVVDIHPPSWAHTCPKFCEALENVFSLACSLAGPPRIPLLSLYAAWNQQECLLPLTPVRGNFARLQACLAELHALPVEGAFRPKECRVAQAVQDGLQQFKQYTRRGMAGATLSSSSMEVTVLTSQRGAEMVKQLEAELQGMDLVSLRQLQVVEISRGGFQGPSDAGSVSQIGEEGAGHSPGGIQRTSGKRPAALLLAHQGSLVESIIPAQMMEHLEEAAALLKEAQQHGFCKEKSCLLTNPFFESANKQHSVVLGTDIDLQVVENDVVALEMFFKGWFHNHSPDQEHLHLLLPAGASSSSHPATPRVGLACLKCDVQERLLSPALLPAACSEDAAGRGPTFWRAAAGAAGPAASHRIRVLRALEAGGLCESLLFGQPLIIKPTNCWQLSWDELEANQHRFQALCHCLGKREWLLLAKYEPQEAGDASWGQLGANAYQVLVPSNSSTLLLRSVVGQELLLPCSLPRLPVEPPPAALSGMEIILNGLEVEPAYNPLHVTSHLYRTLRSNLGRAPAPPRPQPRQPSSRLPRSKARATVAPLHLAPTAVLPLFSSEEDELPEPE